MPFEIVRNDIVNMKVDAIVNTTNPSPWVGSGSDMGIHRKAGPGLLELRKKLGLLRVGDAEITSACDLPARYVIHTVAPAWQGGGAGEEAQLRSCYLRSLKTAKRHRCGSVAFPLIGAGNLGFPRALALQIAMGAIGEFLLENEMMVYLVVFDRESFRLSEALFRGVSSYIDENYVRETQRRQQSISESISVREGLRRRMEDIPDMAPRPMSAAVFEDCAPRAKASREKPSLAQLLRKTDAGFSETLLKLIDQTGKKDSVIYKKANVSKQHFSKIRNNPRYNPTKQTAIAFAIALELDLEQTKDLIGRAGYALTNSSKFDVIIMYFIEQKNYDMFDINAALFEFDQSLLGA